MVAETSVEINRNAANVFSEKNASGTTSIIYVRVARLKTVIETVRTNHFGFEKGEKDLEKEKPSYRLACMQL